MRREKSEFLNRFHMYVLFLLCSLLKSSLVSVVFIFNAPDNGVVLVSLILFPVRAHIANL